jgi:hypothetical protein
MAPLEYSRDYATGRLVGRPSPTESWTVADWIRNGGDLLRTSGAKKLAGKDVYIYRNNCALPRAFFVHHVHSLEDSASVLNSLASASVHELGASAWVETSAQGPILNSGELNVGEIKMIEYTPDRIVLDVQAAGAGFMVLSMAWSPYWKARVNRVVRPIVRTNHALMGLSIQSEDKSVVLEYEPPHRTLAALNGVLPSDWRKGRAGSNVDLGTIPSTAMCPHEFGPR